MENYVISSPWSSSSTDGPTKNEKHNNISFFSHNCFTFSHRDVQRNSIQLIFSSNVRRDLSFAGSSSGSSTTTAPISNSTSRFLTDFIFFASFSNQLRSFSFSINSAPNLHGTMKKTMPSKVYFLFVANKNHDFDPHTVVRCSSIQFDIHRFADCPLPSSFICSNATCGHHLGARNFRTRSHSSSRSPNNHLFNGHRRIFGCCVVFLFGFNCFLMIRSGITCLMASALIIIVAFQ